MPAADPTCAVPSSASPTNILKRRIYIEVNSICEQRLEDFSRNCQRLCQICRFRSKARFLGKKTVRCHRSRQVNQCWLVRVSLSFRERLGLVPGRESAPTLGPIVVLRPGCGSLSVAPKRGAPSCVPAEVARGVAVPQPAAWALSFILRSSRQNPSPPPCASLPHHHSNHPATARLPAPNNEADLLLSPSTKLHCTDAHEHTAIEEHCVNWKRWNRDFREGQGQLGPPSSGAATPGSNSPPPTTAYPGQHCATDVAWESLLGGIFRLGILSAGKAPLHSIDFGRTRKHTPVASRPSPSNQPPASATATGPAPPYTQWVQQSLATSM